MSEEKKEDEMTDEEMLQAELDELNKPKEEDTEEVVESEEDESEGEEESTEEETEEETEADQAEETAEETTEEETDPEEKEAKPDNAAFARQRRELKKLKDELAKAQEQKKPVSESLDGVVKDLAKVWESGDGDDTRLLSKVRTATSQELDAIHAKAINGEYGDQSADVINMINREIPMVERRERSANETKKQTQERVLKEIEAETAEAKEDYPEYADPESAASKAKAEFDAKFIGYNEKTGEFSGELPEDLAAYLQSRPLISHQLHNIVFKSSQNNSETSASEVKKLNKKLETLQKKLDRYTGLENPSAPSRSASTDGRSIAELEAALAAM